MKKHPSVCLYAAPVAGWATQSGLDRRCGTYPLSSSPTSISVSEYALASWLKEIENRNKLFYRVILVQTGLLTESAWTRLREFGEQHAERVEFVTPKQVKRNGPGKYATKSELEAWASRWQRHAVAYPAAVALSGLVCFASR